MSSKQHGMGVVLVLAGLGFFAASVYLMYLYNVLASLMSAAIGFASISMGVDLLKQG